MLIACIVIVYIVFLRYMYEKKVHKEHQQSGVSPAAGPADYASLKKALDEMSDRLARLERVYPDSSERAKGSRP